MARDARRATVSTLPRVLYLAVVCDKLNAGLVAIDVAGNPYQQQQQQTYKKYFSRWDGWWLSIEISYEHICAACSCLQGWKFEMYVV